MQRKEIFRKETILEAIIKLRATSYKLRVLCRVTAQQLVACSS